MAAIFAVCLMLLIVGAGAAIDFTAISAKKSKYQGMADAAVLAAAKSGEKKQKDLKKIALAAVEANNQTGDKVKVKVKLNNRTGKLQVFVIGKHKTALMGLFGKPNAPIEALAEAPLSISDSANIALVLDTTYSMSGTKIATLKTAANSMVDTLAVFKNENLRMSVVPFAQYVNVGLSRRNEVWITETNNKQVRLAVNCYYPVIGQTNCRMVHYGPTPAQPGTPPGTCYNDGVPYSCGGSAPQPAQPGGSYQACDNVYASTQTCEPQYDYYTWKGCVGSRTSPKHLAPNYKTVKIHGVYDLEGGECGSEILPLTKDLNKVKSVINGLTPQGETYLPSGLMWGWRTLTKQMPLTEANAQFKKNTRSIMILMTDGENTLSKNYSSSNEKLHDAGDVADANKISKKLCNKMKKQNVEIYTIAYDIKSAGAKNVVKNCASSPKHYFDAKSSAQLKAAFEDIGQSLLKLRLTH